VSVARRRGRSSGLEGVLVVDKPAGPTSHDVVQSVRRALGESRVGHTGTLDPSATGVLVLCVGRATRLVRFLQAGRKTYAARMVLGITTDSQDADGTVLRSVPAGHIDERTLCEALTRFQGRIEQIPPMVSAVKVDGERLHAKARRGEEVEREARTVTVDDLILDAFEPGEHPEASFLVTCTAGTYVRTLAHDVGEVLEVGASLRALRRLANGPFTAADAHPLDAITSAGPDGAGGLLLDVRTAITRALPHVTVDDPDLLLALARGGRMPPQDRPGTYAVVDATRLVGLYRDGPDGGRAELVWLRPEELG
jgi:tRNA pseudouridine55 synthase